MLRDVMIRLITSAIGILVGVSAFIVLGIVYRNHDVGYWSAISGALAGVCFYLHWKRGTGSLERWHATKTLEILHIIGFLNALSGIAAVIEYVFLTFYYEIPIYPISESTIIKAVWALICAKWGVLLMYYTNKYAILVREGTEPILIDTA